MFMPNSCELYLYAQYIPYRIGGFFLSNCCYMGVGVQGKACGEVTQHAADRFDIHTVLQGDGGEGVTEVVDPDFRDTCPVQYTLQYIVHAVRGDGAATGRWEHIGVLGFRFLYIQNFYRLWGDAHGAVGVFCFQWGFYDLTIHSRYLPANLDDPILPFDVLPFNPSSSPLRNPVDSSM